MVNKKIVEILLSKEVISGIIEAMIGLLGLSFFGFFTFFVLNQGLSFKDGLFNSLKWSLLISFSILLIIAIFIIIAIWVLTLLDKLYKWIRSKWDNISPFKRIEKLEKEVEELKKLPILY